MRIDSLGFAGPIRCHRDEAKKSARQAVRRSGAVPVWGQSTWGKLGSLREEGGDVTMRRPPISRELGWTETA